MYTNVRSLVNGTKREELELLMRENNIDIIGITETWGRSDIFDSEIEFSGYKLYRKDRSFLNNKKGGGVALYVKNSLRSVECDDLNLKQCESVWSKIYINHLDYIIVGVCYRSPEADESDTNQLFECITSATNYNRPTLVMGDFNYPGINWLHLQANNSQGHKFVNLVMDCFLEQHVHLPTRENNILDLVLTNELQVKDEVKITAPVGNSDHNVLMYEVLCNTVKNSSDKIRLCYNQADYVRMRPFIREKLKCIDPQLMSVTQLWQEFNDVMQEAIQKFVPVSQMKDNSRKKPLWMTGKVLRTVKKKHKLWKKCKQHNSNTKSLEYKRQVNKASKAVRSAKKEFERKIAKNIKNDSKSFFTYVRSKAKVKTTVGPLRDENDTLITDDHQMAELLNSFFASVFTEEKYDNLPAVQKIFTGTDSELLCSYKISPEMVTSKLNKLKMNKASGIDSVGTRMLIELSQEISDIVAELFNKSLTTGEIPQEWRLANVTAVYKKGKKINPANYRPISLTVNLCKVFESILRDKIMDHLEKHCLIKESQHGFVRKKSCLTNLLVFMEEVTNYLDSGYPVDVIYLDFQKAFDKVPHQRLLMKLAAHGLGGDILQWIGNWLSNRKQRVVLNGQYSGWRDFLSGVPQGSVLGPILFGVYINDIDDSVNCKILKFADDTKIYQAIYSEKDICKLQTD